MKNDLVKNAEHKNSCANLKLTFAKNATKISLHLVNVQNMRHIAQIWGAFQEKLNLEFISTHYACILVNTFA